MLGFSVIAYLVLQAALGIYVGRFIKKEKSFLVGTRELPTGFMAMSIFATWFGAETCIGSASEVFSGGLSAAKAEPFGYAISLLIAGLFVAPKLWNSQHATLGDFVAASYGPTTGRVTAILMIPGILLWAAAQLKAFGIILSSVFPLEIGAAIIIAGLIVIAYTCFSGMMGDILTDTLQGAILTTGLFILLYVIFKDWTWEKVGTTIHNLPDARLHLINQDQPISSQLDRFLVPIFGSLFAQELIGKQLSCKNATQARTATIMGAFLYLIIGAIPVVLGLAGPQLMDFTALNEGFLPSLAKNYLHPAIYVIFTGALISAVLSTIDSSMISVTALVSKNVLLSTRKALNQKQMLDLNKTIVILSGILSITIAQSSESIYDMVTTAASFGTAGIFLISGLALMGRKLLFESLSTASQKQRSCAAISTILMGLITSILAYGFETISQPFTVGSICCAFTYFIVWISYRPRALLKNKNNTHVQASIF